MMVTFVSQCEKNALKKTRRVLDAFADRIGDNTWQTLITEDGLLTVKKMLRQTASKSTAVSCHWIRSRSRSQFLWVVGNKKKFNERGVVPVNTTRRDLSSSYYENDWHYLPLIKSLSALASLLHDWGKASALFQNKLKPSNKRKYLGDPIRHEWISCVLLSAFIKSCANDQGYVDDSAWLTALVEGKIDENTLKNQVAVASVGPLLELPPLAKLVAWLIVSHHRLPLIKGKRNYANDPAQEIDDILRKVTQEWGYENKKDADYYQEHVKQCFMFPNGLVSNSAQWSVNLKKWSRRLLASEGDANTALQNGSYRVVLHHARLSLMLADHFYSSQDKAKFWKGNIGLYANTDFKTKALKQKLDEHLVGVAKQALINAHLMPVFEKEPPVAEDIQALRKPSPKAYKWQDKAVTRVAQWRSSDTKKRGFFAVNMASTGCGKTFANAKIMRALSSDGQSLRFILALGLRTLTLQTGDEYRERVGLDSSELAVLIGSRAVMELHNSSKTHEYQKEDYEESGSLSQQALLAEDIDFDCAIPEKGLATVLTCERDKKFLYAPVLACTIDHLMSATETKRGGRYILPSLRLMSSDLVIDEIDDFTGDDLIAIGRLIHLAGMLGRKVMISSATIPPDLAEGYFKAYRDGWLLYCKTRDASSTIGCAWVDEETTEVCNSTAFELKSAILNYRESHKSFVTKRIQKIKEQVIRRKGDIALCDEVFSHNVESEDTEKTTLNRQEIYFKIIVQRAFDKHLQHHTVDNKTKLAVSFGVVRMANIGPCVSFSKYLLNIALPQNTQIRIMPYHSRQILLLRHLQEVHLDQVLKRKELNGAQPVAFSNPVIRQHLDKIGKHNQQGIRNVLFILVATPVEEVGRDHDLDWAVVEPSSYRSIIQLAGRVRRHRKEAVLIPNISLLQYNWKGIKHINEPEKAVFTKPGFEGNIRFDSHKLDDLLDKNDIEHSIDASPRILKSDRLQASKNFADMEHSDTQRLLGTKPHDSFIPDSLQGYLTSAWFLTAMPQALRPFRSSEPSVNIFLAYIEDEERFVFCEKDERGYPVEKEGQLGIHRAQLTDTSLERLWLHRDYSVEVIKMAEEKELSIRQVSLRYGELSFPANRTNTTYEYSDHFGLIEV